MRKMHWVAMLPFYLLATIVVIALVRGGRQAITAIQENLPPPQGGHTIVIDAGHGGIDGGTTSCTGVLESKLNLEFAIKLRDLFHLLGYTTEMIRTTDTSIHTEGTTIAAQKVSDLKERVRIANATRNAVYLSIHQNAFPSSRYGGPQVFYAKTDGSKDLAQKLQSALNSTLAPDSKRLSKQAQGVYIMEHIQCTGVLVECGFLSNPKEEAMLRSEKYQKRFCAVLAAAVSGFLHS